MTDDIPRSLPFTQWAVAELSPAEWQHVSTFVAGLLSRSPLHLPEGKRANGWEAERLILGCLARELDQNAQERGEPPAAVAEDELWIERQRWPDQRISSR